MTSVSVELRLPVLLALLATILAVCASFRVVNTAGAGLRTPRVGAAAGIIDSILPIRSLSALRSSIPGNGDENGVWLGERASRVTAASPLFGSTAVDRVLLVFPCCVLVASLGILVENPQRRAQAQPIQCGEGSSR